jgi:hypothetical protein
MPTIQHLPISAMGEFPGNATLDQILSIHSDKPAILHSWRRGKKGCFVLVMTDKKTAIRAMQGISGDISWCQLLDKGPEMVRAHRKALKSRRSARKSDSAFKSQVSSLSPAAA